MAITLSRGEETLAGNFGIFESERPVAGKGESPKFNQHHTHSEPRFCALLIEGVSGVKLALV
jgi:hypothetical protein